MKSELEYLLALRMINRVGNISAKKIVAFMGSAEAVFNEPNKLSKNPNISPSLKKKLQDKGVFDKVKIELDFIEKNNLQVHTFYSDTYPQRLKRCEDAPLLFFSKGDVDFNQSKIISVVGTRKPTPYGKIKTAEIVKELCKQFPNIIIISGLAYGVDVLSHKSALENNAKTIAVMGTPMNTLYPSAHKKIAADIANHGAIISEYLSAETITPANFIQRNRIVAGMSDATLVVETAIKGGSMSTAAIANSYNRDVFALPGRAGEKLSEGCNWLIKKNIAVMTETASDIIKTMNWDIEKKTDISTPLFVDLSKEEEGILTFLRETDDGSIDNLAHHFKMPVSKMSPILLELEFKGLIASLPGRTYQCI